MGEGWRRAVQSGALVDARARCEEDPPEGLLAGIQLFNAGAFYECHHALEEIWHAEREPIRYLYQGILQIGVGFHHLRNRNYRGATALLRDGIDKAERYRPCCLGIDVERLCAEARHCLEAITELGPDRLEGFDWGTVPAVHRSIDVGPSTAPDANPNRA